MTKTFLFLLIFSLNTFASSENQQAFSEIFNSKNAWLNQNAVVFDLNSINKHKYVGYVLSYTSCPTLCPMISSDLKKIKKLVSDKYDWNIVLISIDPENDTPKKLKTYLIKHKMNEKDFEFITGSKPLLKKLSEVLKIGFSDAQDGNHIGHSSVMVVYNQDYDQIAAINLSDGKAEQWKKLLEGKFKKVN